MPLRLGGPRIRLLSTLAVSASIVMLFAGRADAFCRTTTKPLPQSYSPTRGCFTEGLPLYWKNACVSYSIQREATENIPLEEATRVIDQAFGTWNSATCDSGGTVGIQTSNLGPVDCSEIRYNSDGPNQNVIVFRTAWPYNDANNTLGLTTVTFNAENGEIYDADMEINASAKNLTTQDPPPANGFDLLSVVTHEAGHFLGLAHATDNKATMFASYKPGTTTLRSLTADDVAGVCAIYPDATTREVAASVAPNGKLAAEKCDANPRRGFTTACAVAPKPTEKGCAVAAPGSASPSMAVAVAGLLALGIARGRARSRARRV